LVTKEQVKQMISSKNQTLLKYVDTNFNFTPTTSAYTQIVACSMPTAGDSANNVSGDAMRIVKFEVHSSAVVNSATSFDTLGIRTGIVQNVQPGGTGLLLTDIFDYTASNTAIVSPYSYAEKNNVFKLCKDHRYQVSTVWNSNIQYDYECKPKISNTRYGAAWETGTPYIYHVCSTPNSSSEIIITGYVRMWFYDV
jgi:hypothetical protein